MAARLSCLLRNSTFSARTTANMTQDQVSGAGPTDRERGSNEKVHTSQCVWVNESEKVSIKRLT